MQPTATTSRPRPGYEHGTVVPAGGGARVPVGVRRARLDLVRVDPWSAMKLAFVLSLALAVVIVVAVAVLWFVLDSAGVFATLDRTVTDVTGDSSSLTIGEVFAFQRVMGFAMVVAVIHVVLLTALATLAAFLYNLSVGMVGGLEVTLAEDA